MKMILMRHGEAVQQELYKDRPLSQQGKDDTAKTARFLKAGGIKVDQIWHSSKKRAAETAEIVSKIVKPVNGVVEKQGLLPDDDPEAVFGEIIAQQKDVMIVGHIPFLQKLTSLALLNSGAFEVVKFNLGGVVCLELLEGKWLLIFELMPEIVR